METNQTSSTTQKPKYASLANILLLLGLGILLVVQGYFAYRLHEQSNEQQQLKEDYAMFNNISFGLFSVDLWSDKISAVVSGKIKDFEVTAEQKREIRKQVETQLHTMVNEVVKQFNKKQKGIGNKLKKFAFKQFVDPKELHAEVPGFAKTIVDRLLSKKATNKLKDIANTKFEELADQTYDSTGIAIAKVTRHMYSKYKVDNPAALNIKIERKVEEIRKVNYNYAYALLCTLLIVMVIWASLRKKKHLQTSLFVMSLLFALLFLFVGVTVPIIEVDARLSSLNFLMMGEKVAFGNQVLFYQSKSILDIAIVLLQQPKPDAITVGVIIILFVIILPILRITSRGIHLLCKPLIAENKVTRYLAFESAKWDMADVMVVGILMTYIGLNGILKSQLTDLNIKNEFLTTSTVNYTSLQPGYIMFVGYVVFAIMLSYMLKRLTCNTK